MLHSLPVVLDDLEKRLVAGEDPLPLLASIRWPDLVDWPQTKQDALNLKQRLANIAHLINGLQAPLQATLMGLKQDVTYEARGARPVPKSLSLRFQGSV